MKKKLIIAIIIFVPFISILLAILFRSSVQPSNEDIIKDLKDIKYYTTNVEYTIKNARGEEIEETTQYYSVDKGARIDFGQDRIKIYKDGQILIKDNISNKEYTIEDEVDKMHTIAFMSNLLSYPIDENSISEGQEEWGDTQYIEFTCELFLDNDNFNKIKVYIDKNEKVPIGAVIYDKYGKDRVVIVYKDFKKLKQLDDGLI